jgi:hypothetical protein
MVFLVFQRHRQRVIIIKFELLWLCWWVCRVVRGSLLELVEYSSDYNIFVNDASIDLKVGFSCPTQCPQHSFILCSLVGCEKAPICNDVGFVETFNDRSGVPENLIVFACTFAGVVHR